MLKNYERRAQVRLKKDALLAVYNGNEEYMATLIDISSGGIAFESPIDIGMEIGREITITLYDEYEDFEKETKQFAGNIQGFIRNITLTDEGNVRYGCMIRDPNYSEYVQEQYIMIACNSLRREQNYGTA